MGIQFTGLASGLDTQSIIKELMKVEQIKVDRVQKEQTKLEWKKDVWEEVNTKIYDFYKDHILNMTFQGTFMQNKVSVPFTNSADIQVTVNSVRGTHTLEVSELARGSFLNSEKVTKNATYNPDETDEGDNSITLKVGEEESKTIKLETGDNYQKFVDKINNSGLGVKASYDETYGRIFISSTKTGAGTQISIEGIDGNAEKAFLNNLGFSNSSTVVSGTSVDNINSQTSTDTGSFTINEKQIDFIVGDNATSLINKINDVSAETGVTAQIDSDRIILTSLTGESINISAEEDSSAYSFLSELGLKDSLNKVIYSNPIEGLDGKDAIFKYNGTELTSNSNEVKVNGINITLKEQTISPLTFTITQDTDAIYEKVKEFVIAYNELTEELQKKLGAPSSRGYDPLTKEEKEAMSEKEIEEYETLIKDSLLRRDETLQNVLSSMRLILGSKAEGASSLSDIGIYTGDWSEKGKLHIYGDEDDPAFSPYNFNAKTLREMIEEDPEKVMKTINGLASEIRYDMQDKMAGTKLKSGFKFYNNKYMDEKIDDYKEKVKELEKKMEETEQRYYKKFTALEKIMQQMNSQSDWLGGQLAGLMGNY